jgi:hypothetical protein
MKHNFNISQLLLTTAVAVLVSGGATLSPAAAANSVWARSRCVHSINEPMCSVVDASATCAICRLQA